MIAVQRQAVAEQWILFAGQAGEFGAGDPGPLDEFELAREVGVEAEEVEPGFLVGTFTPHGVLR